MEHSLWQFFVDHRPQLVVDVAKAMSTFGDETVLVLAAVLLFAFGVAVKRRTASTFGPLVALVPTVVVVGVMKALINRDRPPSVSALVHVTSASMPSGHAAYAAALAATVWVVTAGTSGATVRRTAAIGAAVLAGIARMVLGVHWFGDVLAGWLVGATIGFCVVRELAKRLQSNP